MEIWAVGFCACCVQVASLQLVVTFKTLLGEMEPPVAPESPLSFPRSCNLRLSFSPTSISFLVVAREMLALLSTCTMGVGKNSKGCLLGFVLGKVKKFQVLVFVVIKTKEWWFIDFFRCWCRVESAECS